MMARTKNRMDASGRCERVVLAGLLSAALMAPADTAYLLPAGSTQSDGLTNAAYWDPAIAPGDAVGATTDFVVQDGLTLKTATTTATFPGKSLQLGASDFASAGNFKDDKSGTLSVSDLRLYRGTWSYENSRQMILSGSATVYSTASDPYVINYTGFLDGWMNFKLTGDETSAIKLTTWQGTNRGADTKPLFVQADQSQTYSGSWVIGPGVYFYAFPASSNGGGNNSTAAMQFGKPLSTFNPRALVMMGGSIIRYEVGDPRTFAASDNRGLTLDAKGKKVTYRLVNSKTHNFGWPFAGDGLFFITGSGTFNLRASCAVPVELDGSTPRFVLCSGSSITATGGLVLPPGYVLSLEAATDRVTVHNLTTTNALFRLPVSANGSSCAQLRLAGDVNLTGVIGLGLSQAPNVAAETDIPVLVIDSAVTRTFTAADFNPYGVPGGQIPNATGVKVARDAETGDQIVSVTVVPYVKTRVAANSSNWGYFAAWAWGDGSTDPVLGDGKTYMTWDTHVGHNGESNAYEVPCDRLILYNPSHTGFGMFLRDAKTIFPSLLVTDRTRLWAYSYYTGTAPQRGQPHEVAGAVEVQTSPGNAFELVAARSQITVSATITGSGTIRARSTPTTYTPASQVEMTGVNTGYDGAFHAYNDMDAVTNACILKIASEENLGGNPRVFAADALTLGYGCIFTPTAALTIDDANRGVTFSASTNVESEVWTGATLNTAYDLTVETPVVFEAGAFAKTNSGTFAWGKGGTTVAAGATLAVKEGAVKPQGFGALGGMSLSLSAGAALAFDFPLAAGDSRAAYGVDMRASSISHSGAKVAVRLDLDEGLPAPAMVSVPLATFATGADAQAFADAAAVSVPRGYGVSLEVKSQTIDGVAVSTLVANVVKIGFRCVIR